MSSQELRRAFREVVDVEVRRLGSNLVSGFCSDYADYRYQAGIIKGLYTAVEMMDEEFKKMHSLNKEDEI